MFGAPATTGFGGFGSTQQVQPQQSPFGGGFGQQPQASPFGAPQSGGLFGSPQPQQQQQQQQPTFGLGGLGTATPAFGAASTPAFGASSTFGTTFGAASQPTFGAPSSTGFGNMSSAPSLAGFGSAASAPGFGSTPTLAFGSTGAFGGASAVPPFGQQASNTFGQPTAPAFGAGPTFGSATPAFGAQQPGTSPFGTPAVGGMFAAASTPAFGSPAGGSLFGGASTTGTFGAAPVPATPAGTRAVPFVKTNEKDGSGTSANVTVMFNSISAMPAYANKSHEELRFEDYQQGVKTGASGGQQQQQPGMFGQPITQAVGAFGQPPAGTNAFGQAQNTSVFGQQPTSTGSFFNSSTTPAFGQASTPAFGSTPTPAFGQPSAVPAFGQQPALAAFGQQPGFGGFGAGSTPTFGNTASSPSIFGAQPAPSFSSTGGVFGQPASTPAFGAASSASAFGFGSTTPSIFGNTHTAAAPASSFGTTAPAAGPNIFGTSSAANTTFGNPGAFGSNNAFSAKPATQPVGGIFGNAFASAATPSLPPTSFGTSFNAAGAFGTPAPSSAPTFSFSTPGVSPPMFGQATQMPGPSPFGTGFNNMGGQALTPQAGQQQVGQQQAPNVSQAPYGSFPPLAQVPEPKVGISARTVRAIGTPSGTGITCGAARAGISPLTSMRSGGGGVSLAAGRFGSQLRPQRSDMLGSSLSTSTIGSLMLAAAQSKDLVLNSPTILPTRANPHRLFIREPPPSTEAALSPPALTPSRSSGDGGDAQRGPDRPAMPANSRRTPDHHQNGTAPEASGHTGGPPSPCGTNDRAASNGRAASSTAQAANPEGVSWEDSTEPAVPQLGRLAREGYFFEPTPSTLESWYRENPAKLRAVNFIVGRHGVGQIRWLRAVDVTGLRLERLVTISPGEVYCYPDPSTKPPVGEGLNRDAEIILYNVYKRDKATGQPIRNDPVRLLKYEKYLRATCAKTGARHVSYKPDAGVWKFEVEHFSRYGLNPDLDDSDLEEDDLDDICRCGIEAPPSADALAVNRAAGSREADDKCAGDGGNMDLSAVVPRFGCGDGHSDDSGDDNHQAAFIDINSEDEPSLMTPLLEGLPRGRHGAVSVGPSAPLQQTRPDQSGFDPKDLQDMSEAFFAPAPPVSVPTAPAAGRHSRSSGGGAVAVVRDPGAGSARRPPLSAAPLLAAGGGDAGPPLHNWRRQPPPLRALGGSARGSGSSMGGSRTAHAAASAGSVGRGAQPQLLLESGSPLPAPVGHRGTPPAPTRLSDVAHSSSLLVDAGLSLGRSFRAAWGPSGTLLHTGSGSAVMERVRVEGQATAYSDDDDMGDAHTGSLASAEEALPLHQGLLLRRLRERLRAALQLHCRHSVPLRPTAQVDLAAGGQQAADGGVGKEGAAVTRAGEAAEGVAQQGWQGAERAVPQWDLRVGRTQLAALVAQYVQVCTEQLAALTATSNEEAKELQQQLKHESQAWRLLQVLYGHIEGEDEEDDGAAEAAADADVDIRSSTGHPGGRSALAVYERQAALSHWLRLQAKPRVEQALQQCRSAPEVVLQLLTGHQLAAATAAAATSGDVRLATLCAQAGVHSQSQADAAAQLDTWQVTGMQPHIHPARLQVYQLLAGRVSAVQNDVHLDWRRYLGLLLWYAPRPAIASSPLGPVRPSAPVRQYIEQLLVGHGGGASPGDAPPPLAHHLEQSAWSGGPAGVAAVAAGGTSGTDTHWELLRLWAETEGRAETLLERGIQIRLAPLLRSSGYSSNCCDAALGWHLLTVLEAIGGVPSVQQTQSPEEHVAAFMAFISQLELVGGMSEWAVYVALHLPDVLLASGAGVTRQGVVSELLQRHCPDWAANSAKRAFLSDTLRLPPALLADAEVVWASYQRDSAWQGRALLAAGQPREAHALLVEEVMPPLFLANRLSEVAEYVDALQPYCLQLPDWELGAGLYCGFLELHMLLVPGSAIGPADARAGEEGATLTQAIADAAEVQAGRLAAASSVLQGRWASGSRITGKGPQREFVRQQMVLSHMVQQVHDALLGRTLAVTAPGDAVTGERVLRAALQCGCLPPDLQKFTLATGSAYASSCGLEAF